MTRYDRRLKGLRLKPSGDGLIVFPRLTRETRATLVGIDWPDGKAILLTIDGGRRKRAESWERRYWIPLGGNREWGVVRGRKYFTSAR